MKRISEMCCGSVVEWFMISVPLSFAAISVLDTDLQRSLSETDK